MYNDGYFKADSLRVLEARKIIMVLKTMLFYKSASLQRLALLFVPLDFKPLLADKAYDMNELREWLASREIKAVIPPKSNQKEEIECDYWHYKARHAIECMFGKLKHYRRIATRYEKKAINYMGMLSFSSVLLWLR